MTEDSRYGKEVAGGSWNQALNQWKLQLPWGSSSFPGGPVVKNLSCSAKHLVLSLVREEPTCLGAAKPVCHNYWASSLESSSHNYWAQELQSRKPTRPRACALQQEKPPAWEATSMRSLRTVRKSSLRSLQPEKAKWTHPLLLFSRTSCCFVIIDYVPHGQHESKDCDSACSNKDLP